MGEENICELCKRAEADGWWESKSVCSSCYILCKYDSLQSVVIALRRRSNLRKFLELYPGVKDNDLIRGTFNKVYLREVIKFHKMKYC